LGFSKLGHKVFACSRKMPYLEDLTRLDGGENIVPVQLDITLPDSVKNLSEKIGNLNIDILVNSAGGDMTGPKDGGLEDYTMEEFSEAFNLNVFGTFEVIKTIIPKMKKESNPIIFTLSSVAGQANTNNVGLPYHLAKNSESKMLDFLSKDIYPIRSTDLIISTVNSFRKEEMKDSAMTPEDIFSVIKFISESPSYLTVDKIHLRHINSGGAI
jgi:NADP-dependent 3-hydroxy acid dehydrogenase YdfG